MEGGLTFRQECVEAENEFVVAFEQRSDSINDSRSVDPAWHDIASYDISTRKRRTYDWALKFFMISRNSL